MQVNLKKERRYQKVEQILKNNLKKRKIFLNQIKKKNKKVKKS